MLRALQPDIVINNRAYSRGPGPPVGDFETPEQRIAEAIRMGEACLDVYLAALPPGTTREEARARAARMKGLGRRRSDASLS